MLNNSNNNNNNRNNQDVKHLINRFFALKDYKSREAGLILLELSLAIFNYFKKAGKIQRMKEYDYMYTDEDILQDICRCIIQYHCKHNPVLNPQKKPSFKDLVDICQEIFTSRVQSRCCEIDRIINTENNKIIVSDREFQSKFKRKYRMLNTISKRNTKSVEDFRSDDGDELDFFERAKIDNCYFPSVEEILINREEETLEKQKAEHTQEENTFIEAFRIIKDLIKARQK